MVDKSMYSNYKSIVCVFFSLVLAFLHAQESEIREQPAPKDVLIIGGGIAGMAAARKLMSHSSKNYQVTVMEAKRNRYGGRIWTNKTLFQNIRGAEADLGALWVNSQLKDNPIMNIIDQYEIPKKQISGAYIFIEENKQIKILKGTEVNKIYTEAYSIIQKAVDTNKNSEKDVSLKDSIFKIIEEHEFQTDKEVVKKIISTHRAVLADNYSTRMFHPAGDFGWDTVVLDGYAEVVDVLASGDNQDLPVSVELSRIIRHIEIDEDAGKVKVRSRDLKQYIADIVIVAVPFNVIKNQNIIFSPPLPDVWKSAAEKIGTMKTNKVIVGFEKSFWPEDVAVFLRISDTSSDAGFLQSWVNFYHVTKKPYLMGLVYGEKADELEFMSMSDLKLKVISILGKMFGEDVVKGHNITHIIRSKWQSDQQFLGAGYFPKTGATVKLFDKLSKPVCPYLYFAGDYLIPDHMFTAHGAYMSGVQAAQQILSHWCKLYPGTKKKTTKHDNITSNDAGQKKNKGDNIMHVQKDEL